MEKKERREEERQGGNKNHEEWEMAEMKKDGLNASIQTWNGRNGDKLGSSHTAQLQRTATTHLCPAAATETIVLLPDLKLFQENAEIGILYDFF